ncbi:MAG: hypothetical protein M1840_004929 [Geoglossum simile]|nr:MAG: hypothetical protein M1840_004929 [Geoglossum simile]
MAADSGNFHIHQRVSFRDTNQLCTVRYIGPVEGTKGDWLGVEWDDPNRGKHSGMYGGKRLRLEGTFGVVCANICSYQQGNSDLATAASFVRPARPTSTPLSFLEALHKKYASETLGTTPTGGPPEGQKATEAPIKWGSKVVEEVGFEKIRRQLAILNELRIVILDGMSIACVSREMSGRDATEQIRQTCPKIIELDVGRNLFEQWADIVHICEALDGLRSLRVKYVMTICHRRPARKRLPRLISTAHSGNRFSNLTLEDRGNGEEINKALAHVRDLGLDNNFISWKEIATLTTPFISLTSLSASENNLSSLSPHLVPQSLTTLTLERNNFTSLSVLSPLAALQNLQRLSLKSNKIRAASDPSTFRKGETDPKFPEALSYVDLSYNAIGDWPFIDNLSDVFPGLTGLRVSHNPLYEDAAVVEADGKTNPVAMGVEEGYMLTLARLKGLKSLNFSNITPQERTNAEMYYLSRIGKALAAVPETDEPKALLQHRRYAELCDLYGPPVISRVSTSEINPNSLEARLINIKFRLEPSGITKHQEIPKGVDVYRLKGIVGRMFGVRPLGTRVVWESNEWDPVGGSEDGYDDDDEDEGGGLVEMPESEGREDGEKEDREKGKWVRREVELEDGTREIGFWIEGREATVRVELR